MPYHRRSWGYFLGGLSLFFLLVQVATGLLLLLYYRPTPEAAFDSVQLLRTQVEFGWLVRSVHAWSASAVVAAAAIHMASVFLAGAHAPPRERTWWTGLALLGLTLALGFTGYLLPWDARAFFATKVGTDLVGKVPLAGAWLLRVLRGGDEVGGATLTRFFALHAAILPLAVLALLAAHLLQVHRHGLHVPRACQAEADRRPALPFFPDFAVRELAVWIAALGALAALATIFPWPLGERADPFVPAPAGIRPEWYFLPAYELLRLLPARVAGVEGERLGLAAFAVAGLLAFLAPLLDRAARRGEPRRLAAGAGAAALGLGLALAALAALTDPAAASSGAPSPGRAAAAVPAAETCPGCHAKLGGKKSIPALVFADDVHARPGLGCAGCHGGDPTQRAQYQAMDSEKGFRRLSFPEDVLQACGGCHGEAARVRRFAPDLPTDQLAKLLAGRHAPRYAASGREAAVCISCHGAHGIFAVRDPRASVHPARLAERCTACHAREGDGTAAAAAACAALADGAESFGRAEGRVAELGARGVVLAKGEATLEEGREQLAQALALVHGADAPALEARARATGAAARTALAAAGQGAAELRSRRRGLFVALLLALGAIGAIAVWNRQHGSRAA